jgi:hypothetical protein
MARQASASFFEKEEAKKLLLTGGFGPDGATARSMQKFFASFFQKRSACLLTSSVARKAWMAGSSPAMTCRAGGRA